MLKSKFKIIVTIITIIALISAFCITVKATDDTPTPISEEANVGNEVDDSTNEEVPEEDETTEEPTEEVEPEDEMVYDDLYLFENNITMDKIVDGNLYVFGDNITITGKINGNVFAFGNNITFTNPYPDDDTEHQNENYCYITGNVYALASNKITFNAVAQDIYALSDVFEMSYDSYITRDIRIAASDITIKGYITRNANLSGDKFNFGTHSDNEEEDDAAIIGGNLNYSSQNEIEIPEDVVQGETKFNEVSSTTTSKSATDYLMDLLSALIYTIVLYLIFIWLAPKFFNKTSEILKTSTLSTLGIGLLAFVVTPILALILLCLTLSSLSLLLAVVYGLILAISSTVVFGSLTLLFKDKLGFANKQFLLFIIITIVAWALEQIPVLGLIINVAILVFGLGLVIKNVFNNKNNSIELINEKN